MYYSAYGDQFLNKLASEIRTRARGATVWCIFDNTAAGAATGNGLALLNLLGQGESREAHAPRLSRRSETRCGDR